MRRFALSLVLLLSSCGPPALGPSPEEASEAWQDGIPGTYVLDADRNTARTITDAEGTARAVSDEVIAQIQASLKDTRLTLKADNTWTLDTGTFKTAGSWRQTATGIVARTMTVGDEAAQPEHQVEESYGVERGYLVMQAGDQRLYLRKLKPE